MPRKPYDKWPQARRYRDFREMLDAEGDKIDAVYCGTPDHTHAVITPGGAQAKETRLLREAADADDPRVPHVVGAARKAGVATQVTAAPNTSETACRTCELIWAGAIGAVREVHIWSNRPLWPQGMLRPTGQDAVPSTLDWDLWIGPAPMRPFKAEWPEGHLRPSPGQRRRRPRPAVYHPWNFRGWWDFGTGALGDMGCHHLNTPFRALKLNYPTAIEASATKVFDETAPLGVDRDLRLPRPRATCRRCGSSGTTAASSRPVRRQLEGRPLPALAASCTWATRAMMLDGRRSIPAARAKKFGRRAQNPAAPVRHLGRVVRGLPGGEPAGCHFEWAGLLTEFVLLGNIAIRTGKRLDWDAENVRFHQQSRRQQDTSRSLPQRLVARSVTRLVSSRTGSRKDHAMRPFCVSGC